ncbi:MAG: hypothetical protein HRU14_01430 [Planctomycetes bacterium]|nr:hypothetical protein [Planctomycetota bacterium]
MLAAVLALYVDPLRWRPALADQGRRPAMRKLLTVASALVIVASMAPEALGQC